ncbi:glycine zipper 2TM domain-containing protein [Lysobacter sp. N42]|uniref:glycine zipper 2TM domain-containing protein n=1 Tax=Lysobacter sp. N42 TaxID=2545719 RepID=UPI001046C4BD|nr:glycine zipper 2TM domain-containing protein [Lysobacter sp. N42]TCZ88974.1 glycine zipper 2TM domain-containing protein [Lysobacter sp. N42]
MDKNILAVALGSMLLGGVAVAAYNSFGTDDAARFEPLRPAPAAGTAQLDAARGAQAQISPAALAPAPAAQPQLEYAEVVDVDPVTKKTPLYATVIGTEPIRETASTSVPREVCEDVVVQERMPERDGNVGGTVAGAIIGGLVGSRVGDGNGQKAATAAGAVAGGFIGNRLDRRHVGGQVVSRTDRQCRTVMDTSQTSRTIAYNVTYRNPDGTVGSMRTESRPGTRIRLGSDTQTVGYDVTYRYRGSEETVRMSQRPGPRLPVVDGRVMASASGTLASRG